VFNKLRTKKCRKENGYVSTVSGLVVETPVFITVMEIRIMQWPEVKVPP
jgi:hypothetical protein